MLATTLKPATLAAGLVQNKQFSRSVSRTTRSIKAQVGPLVSTEAPDFSGTAVLDQEFIDIKLSDYRGKYVVIFFYPFDFTFVCPTEITAFSDRYDEFKALNAEILGVSIDSKFTHLAWIQTDRDDGGLGEIRYPLVEDVKREIGTAFQVLEPNEGCALRGLFIIDTKGVIQHATINNNAFGRSVDETLRVLQAIKGRSSINFDIDFKRCTDRYTSENPDEVCPAGWTPGEKTMTPDPKASKEFFKSL